MSLATTRSATRWMHISVLLNSIQTTRISRHGCSCCATATPMVSRLRRPCRPTCTPKPTRTRVPSDLQALSGPAPHRSSLSRQTALRRGRYQGLPAGEGSTTSTPRHSRQTPMPLIGILSVASLRLLLVSPVPGSRSRCGHLASRTGLSRSVVDPRRRLLTTAVPRCSSHSPRKALRRLSLVSACLIRTMEGPRHRRRSRELVSAVLLSRIQCCTGRTARGTMSACTRAGCPLPSLRIRNISRIILPIMSSTLVMAAQSLACRTRPYRECLQRCIGTMTAVLHLHRQRGCATGPTRSASRSRSKHPKIAAPAWMITGTVVRRRRPATLTGGHHPRPDDSRSSVAWKSSVAWTSSAALTSKDMRRKCAVLKNSATPTTATTRPRRHIVSNRTLCKDICLLCKTAPRQCSRTDRHRRCHKDRRCIRARRQCNSKAPHLSNRVRRRHRKARRRCRTSSTKALLRLVRRQRSTRQMSARGWNILQPLTPRQ